VINRQTDRNRDKERGFRSKRGKEKDNKVKDSMEIHREPVVIETRHIPE
jgi:hypothetical protein